MLSNEEQLFRVKVVRPCRIRGEEAKVGTEHALKLDEARSAVCSGRCVEVDVLPRHRPMV